MGDPGVGHLVVIGVIFMAVLAAVMAPVLLFLMLVRRVRSHQEHQERLYAELERAALDLEKKAQQRAESPEQKEQ